MIFKREPALITGLLNTALALVVAFGAHLSATQIGAILATSSAVLAVITRTQVSPVNTNEGG